MVLDLLGGGLVWDLDLDLDLDLDRVGLMVLVLVRVVVQCCSRAPPSGPSGLTAKHCSSISDEPVCLQLSC